jgi:predicted nucleotide-binding protein
VFLVHGHDEAAREKVARYLERLELEPIILHEQPNKGRTIIEKFTDYSDVAYAVVLLTADDIGGPKGTNTKQLAVRARPNVLFELGYFIGALGRDRVCALHETGVEILSDYSGVLYVTLDATNAWRLHLAKEMKAAGLPIDMNNAI